MDKHIEESGCYEQPSEVRCKICKNKIYKEDLKFCKQDDGTFICPACLYDADKLQEEKDKD
ncbi:MAG: hypothetical protein IJP61_10135 [Treponema sp.]|nr:hypothetical protein [Treponema sp.]